MKTQTTILFLVLAVAAAQKVKIRPDHLERLTAIRKECAEKENVDLKVLSRIDGDVADFPNQEELKCHTLCSLKAFGALDEEHRFKAGVVKSYLDPEIADKFVQSVKKCLPKDNKFETCEVAYTAHHCVVANL